MFLVVQIMDDDVIMVMMSRIVMLMVPLMMIMMVTSGLGEERVSGDRSSVLLGLLSVYKYTEGQYSSSFSFFSTNGRLVKSCHVFVVVFVVFLIRCQLLQCYIKGQISGEIIPLIILLLSVSACLSGSLICPLPSFSPLSLSPLPPLFTLIP